MRYNLYRCAQLNVTAKPGVSSRCFCPHSTRCSTPPRREQRPLVHRLVCSWHMAAGQLAVFQGASEAPISES
jgi:hypothetical protein